MTVVFDPLRLAEVAWDVGSANAQTPLAIERRQRERLTALLDSPGGVRWLQACMPGREADGVVLQDLPVMHKRERMAHFEDWVADPALRLPQLLQFTADPANIARAFLGRYHVWVSSGTSGEPALFVQDARTMAVYDALESLRRATPSLAMGWPDLGMLGQRIAFVGATSGHFASVVSMERLRRINPWLAHTLCCFSIEQPVSELLQALNAFAPSVIASYPTAAAMLADEAERGNLRVRLREVWTGGETLGSAQRAHIAQALACTVRNSYGASEFLPIGWECAHGSLHVNADWVILEPVDRDYRPVAPGTLSHTTLLTNLANHVQPLIRYEIGDRITVAPERCACGSPLPVIEVQGRQDDVLVLAGRRGRPVTVLPLAVSTVLEDDAGVFDFQLIQRDHRTLALRLALCGTDATDAVARCAAALGRFAAVQGLAEIDLVHEPDTAFLRGRSGKLQRIVALPAGSTPAARGRAR